MVSPRLIAFLSLVVTLASSCEALAQICRPVGERTQDLGCWIIANAAVGQLPHEPIFWHLDTFATQAEANAAKGSRGIVRGVAWQGMALHDRRGRVASVRWRSRC